MAVNRRIGEMRVAVTGATGFLGGHLVQRLLQEGAEVTAAARRVDALVEHENARPVAFDLGDAATFGPLVARQDVVIHVAAWMGRPSDDPELGEAINVDATARLARAASDAGVGRFVHISTVAVYGLPENDVITEETPLNRDQPDPYGRTKARGEDALREAAGGMEVVVLRPGMIHGPRSRVWTRRMLELVKGGTPAVFGRGDGHVFPVFVDNLLDAIVLAAVTDEAAGHAFNLTDGEVTWAEWMGAYGRMCGREPRRVPLVVARALATAAELLPLGVPLKRRHVETTQRKLVFDTTKARQILGWEPRVSFDEAMKRNEAWLRSAGVL